MKCKYASSGCNYPEGECIGLCRPMPESIKAARVQARLTQEEAAQQLAITVRTISRWENDNQASLRSRLLGSLLKPKDESMEHSD